MAQAEHLIPHILRWETGVTKKPNESYEQYFERARKRGYSNDPHDLGGATQSGLTIGSYRTWCKKHNISTPTVDNLKNIPYKTWLAIFKESYWDRYQADKIANQAVADILVDYLFNSGCYAITKIQKALNLKADGVVGPKTLAAINGKSPLAMWSLVKQIRYNHYQSIVKSNPSQKKFLAGWLNRLNSFSFSE